MVLLNLISQFSLLHTIGLEVGRGVHKEVALVAAIKLEIRVSKHIRKPTFTSEMLGLHSDSSVFKLNVWFHRSCSKA
jgi:hypothetical protein